MEKPSPPALHPSAPIHPGLRASGRPWCEQQYPPKYTHTQDRGSVHAFGQVPRPRSVTPFRSAGSVSLGPFLLDLGSSGMTELSLVTFFLSRFLPLFVSRPF